MGIYANLRLATEDYNISKLAYSCILLERTGLE
jgi:hypothetical protein